MKKILNDEYILIIGGNGFLGKFVTKELCKTRAKITIVARSAIKARDLLPLGDVGQVVLKNVDARNEDELEALIKKSTIVINMVGILFETKKQKFNQIHHKLPQNIAMLCKKHKVKKFIHISANNADIDVTYEYAKTKFAGENAVLHHFPNAVIIRPNMIFGEGDSFLNKFKDLSSFSPVLPMIGGGNCMFQPVYAGDVAELICAVVCDSKKRGEGEVLEVAGPQQMKFKYIIQMILKTLGRKRFLMTWPFWFAKTKAFFFELMPKPLLTRDQVELLRNDHILTGEKINALDTFGIEKTPLKVKLENILKY